MSTNEDALVTPYFHVAAVPDAVASREAGCPMYRDEELVEIRIAGNPTFRPVFKAHEMWRREGEREVTYAERWPEAYERFAAGRAQVADGTPLSEAPFLTEAQRQTLRDQRVYSVQALAGLDSKELRTIGPQGRELQQKAKAFLKTAKGSAVATAQAAEIEALRARIAELEDASAPQAASVNPFDTAPAAPPSDADDKAALRDEIEALSGQRPRGNPSVETLRDMLSDLKG